jgi:hypothetical protein
MTTPSPSPLFPRFYFLSNDELLEILAQTKNVQVGQRRGWSRDSVSSIIIADQHSKSVDGWMDGSRLGIKTSPS